MELNNNQREQLVNYISNREQFKAISFIESLGVSNIKQVIDILSSVRGNSNVIQNKDIPFRIQKYFKNQLGEDVPYYTSNTIQVYNQKRSGEVQENNLSQAEALLKARKMELKNARERYKMLENHDFNINKLLQSNDKIKAPSGELVADKRVEQLKNKLKHEYDEKMEEFMYKLSSLEQTLVDKSKEQTNDEDLMLKSLSSQDNYLDLAKKYANMRSWLIIMAFVTLMLLVGLGALLLN